MTRALRRTFRRFRRREEGIASIEFALLFPFVLYMFVWAIELGLIMTKQVMLEHALDVTMRELRLGRMEDPTPEKLKEWICSRAKIVSSCDATIMIELQPISTTDWILPAEPPTCVDREEEIQPVVTFNAGAQNEIMLVRACVIIQPLFPMTGIGAMLKKDSRGGFGMAAVSAFVNEPS